MGVIYKSGSIFDDVVDEHAYNLGLVVLLLCYFMSFKSSCDADSKKISENVYEVLPLRGVVVFPSVSLPLRIGRECSMLAVEDVCKSSDREVVLLTQKDESKESPSGDGDGFYSIGTLATVRYVLRLSQNIMKVVVDSHKRVKVKSFIKVKPYFEVEVEVIDEEEYISSDIVRSSADINVMIGTAVEDFKKYSKECDSIPADVVGEVSECSDPGIVADMIAFHLPAEVFVVEEKQNILGTFCPYKRLELVISFIATAMNVLDMQKRIRNRVKLQMEDTHRKYYLNEQMKAIQKELGGQEGSGANGGDFHDYRALEDKIKNTKLSEEALAKAEDELRKLKMMGPISTEATVIRNYLEWVLGIPWYEFSEVSSDIENARVILDKGHYGMEKLKNRVYEFLAVQSRLKEMQGPVLCFVGPSGIGKTSFVKSIAEATGRSFVKIALGGIHDESEMRGHRRTYIGAMPGKIVQAMKKAKTSNPLILLDEIDKMGKGDFRGDPADALLEILDTDQNKGFVDHYIEVEYDISKVMFIATANTLDIPYALLDRLEIVRLSGYAEEEKLCIARNYLLSKVLEETGLVKDEFSLSDKAIMSLINGYTRESGVRGLKREMGKVARKSLREIISNKNVNKINVTNRNLQKYAGVRKYLSNAIDRGDVIGVITGLAYTESGGDVLSIEAVTMPGTGKIKCTGKLGDVMKESVEAAYSFVLSRSDDYGVKMGSCKEIDIHVHVPEGATPKDGPSAGVAISLAIISILTGSRVDSSVAMTGEVTLSGRVLPVGGIREKLLAAVRFGIKTVLLPKDNEKDLSELDQGIKNSLNILQISDVDEALKVCLLDKLGKKTAKSVKSKKKSVSA